MKNINKIIIYLVPIIVITIGVIITDYFGIFALGLFNKTYHGKIGNYNYSFQYSRKLEVLNNDLLIQISKPEYMYEEMPMVNILFLKNGEFNHTKPFDNILDWYKDFYSGKVTDNLLQVNWLNQKALKEEQDVRGVTDYIKMTYLYGFTPDKEYVIELSYYLPSKFPNALNKEFNQIRDSLKFIK